MDKTEAATRRQAIADEYRDSASLTSLKERWGCA